MNVAVWQKLDHFARSITPFFFTLLLTVLSVVPTHIPDYTQITPIFALVSVYHWAVYRPNLLPLLLVFVLGMVQDLLLGTPIGLYILVFLTVYGIVLSQRRFFIGKSFIFYWLGFATISALASIESYILASAWNLMFLGFDVLIFQYLILLGIFPIVVWLLLKWQMLILQQD